MLFLLFLSFSLSIVHFLLQTTYSYYCVSAVCVHLSAHTQSYSHRMQKLKRFTIAHVAQDYDLLEIMRFLMLVR